MGGTLTRSEVLDELLALVGLEPGQVQGGQVPQPPTPPGAGGRAERDAIEREYETRYSGTPPYATKEQSELLVKKRFALASLLSHFDSDPVHLRAALDELAAAFVPIHNESNREAVLRAKLREQVQKAGAGEAIVVDATALETAPLLAERHRLLAALAPNPGSKATERGELQKLTEDGQSHVNNVEALAEEVVRRKELQMKLTSDLNLVIAEGVTAPEAIVPGSTEDDVKPLLETRRQIAEAIAKSGAPSGELGQLATRIGALQRARSNVVDTVADRAQRKRAIVLAANAAVDGLHAEAERAPLVALKQILTDKTLAVAVLSEGVLAAGQRELEALQKACADEHDITQERLARRSAFITRSKNLATLLKTCVGFDIEAQKTALKDIDRELGMPLHTIDFEAVETAMPDLPRELDTSLERQVAETGKKGRLPVDYIKASANAMVEEGERLAPFAQRMTSELEGLPEQIAKIEEKLEKPNRETVTAAFKILAKMRIVLDDAREIAADDMTRLTDLHAALLVRIEPENPEGLTGKLTERLDADRTKVTEMIGDEVGPDTDPDDLKSGVKLAEAFEADLVIASQVALNWTTCLKRYTAIHKAARQPVQAELTARRAAVEAESDPATAKARCDALTALLDSSEQEAGKAVATKQTLALVKAGGTVIDSATVEAIYDVVGPAALEGLPPKALETLGACFKKANAGQTKNLRTLVTEGFGAEGKVLTSLLRSGDADTLLAFADGFGGEVAKADRKNLRALVEAGGLSEAPTVLDDMLSHGVAGAPDNEKQVRREGNVGMLKNLATSFGDVDGPAQMKTLVADCGLGRPRPGTPPKPGVLAELMQGEGGLVGDAGKLRILANSYSGTDPTTATDRARLDGLMEQGGFAGRPKAFAPLLGGLAAGAGGMAGAAGKLKEIGQTFEPAQDRARLKTLLDDGGMSGDASDDPTRKHDHPDTFAQVFSTGLKGEVAKLKQFTDAFGDTPVHAGQCKTMLNAFNEYPEANRDDRTPGDKVARMLGPKHFNGDVAKLQTRFTTNLELINDVTLKKQAYRLGPHFEKNTNWGWGPATSAMDDADVDSRAYSLKQRHKPETYNFAESNLTKAPLHSQFPPGTDLGALIDEALAAAWPGGNANGKKKVNVGNPSLLVEIAVGGGKVCHFTPHKKELGDPGALVDSPAPPHPSETPSFTTDAMRRIKAACF